GRKDHLEQREGGQENGKYRVEEKERVVVLRGTESYRDSTVRCNGGLFRQTHWLQPCRVHGPLRHFAMPCLKEFRHTPLHLLLGGRWINVEGQVRFAQGLLNRALRALHRYLVVGSPIAVGGQCTIDHAGTACAALHVFELHGALLMM